MVHERLTTFILANFLWPYCYVAKYMSERKMAGKIASNIFVCYIIYILFAVERTVCLSMAENVKEATAIVPQWCIRFECASSGMCIVRTSNFPRQESVFFFFPYSSAFSCAPCSMMNSHDVQAIPSRTTFIWSLKIDGKWSSSPLFATSSHTSERLFDELHEHTVYCDSHQRKYATIVHNFDDVCYSQSRNDDFHWHQQQNGWERQSENFSVFAHVLDFTSITRVGKSFWIALHNPNKQEPFQTILLYFFFLSFAIFHRHQNIFVN